MVFCKNCGERIDESRGVCTGCGMTYNVQKSSVAEAASQKSSGLGSGLIEMKDHTHEFDKNDIEHNKLMAVLSYLGILVIIPIFAGGESRYVRFHANQGLVLLIFWVLYGVVYSTLSIVMIGISYKLFSFLHILGIVNLLVLALCLIGIVNAACGKARELPLIGKFRFLK